MTAFVVICGLSGAGRSEVANDMEDLGWFVIDNVPPTLIPKLGELAATPGSADRIALVVRTAEYDGEIAPALDGLRATGARVRILYLEASTDVLVRRYEGSRRRHPRAGPTDSVAEAIELERAAFEPLREAADVVVETSDLNVHQLRDRIVELFERDSSATGLQTSVVSFGYKHGLPLDVDLVLDCRFLPNPHWVDELRPLTGREEPVRRYVLSQPETREFLKRLDGLLAMLLPAYAREGKTYLTLAVGCTGGRHRSVVLAEEIAGLLRKHGFDPVVKHRDADR
ncbi:MAG: RNase adapter RapZ [Acidimicrobiales bacterium]